MSPTSKNICPEKAFSRLTSLDFAEPENGSPEPVEWIQFQRSKSDPIAYDENIQADVGSPEKAEEASRVEHKPLRSMSISLHKNQLRQDSFLYDVIR